MKNIFFLIFIYLLEKVILDYENIELKYSNSYYYFPLYFPNNSQKFEYIFSTSLPKSFFPSLNCKKCIKYRFNETEFIDEHKNVSIPYYFYNYIGRLFSGNYSIGKYSSINEQFVFFDNLTYARNYSGLGRFSLSYLNYNFNTTKKLFAIKFTEDKAELHLGDYDHNRNMDELKTFNIITEIKDENYTETIIVENENISTLYDNKLLIEEDDNKTHEENITIELNKSVWYMEFPKLIIKKEQDEEVDHPLKSYKLTLDMSNDYFYIPRDFFIKNVQKIFPKDGKCQITKAGYFSCQCDEYYKSKFGNFKFISSNGVEFLVNVTDYMTYRSSVSGSRCFVYIMINYDNDLFIGGVPVMNNYYSIFDVDNKTFSILPRENENMKETGKYILMFFVTLILSIGFLFGGYYFYNKKIINNPTGLIQDNNDNDHNNQNRIHNIMPFDEDQQNLRNEDLYL